MVLFIFDIPIVKYGIFHRWCVIRDKWERLNLFYAKALKQIFVGSKL